MENKYLKYGLIAGALFVWGAIIFRVVGAVSGPAVPLAPVRIPAVVAPPPVQDSFVLFADYPDPFFPESDTTEEIDVRKPGVSGADRQSIGMSGGNAAAVPATSASPPAQSFIQYVGIITNPDTKAKVAIINLHGQELLMKEKEKREDLVVKKISKDRIEVLYNGKAVTIYKNN